MVGQVICCVTTALSLGSAGIAQAKRGQLATNTRIAASAQTPSEDIIVIPAKAMNAIVWHALSRRNQTSEPITTTQRYGIHGVDETPTSDYSARLKELESIFANTVFARFIALTRGTPAGSGSSLSKLINDYHAAIGMNANNEITNPNIHTVGDCISAFFDVASKDPAYLNVARQVYYELRDQSNYRDANGDPVPGTADVVAKQLRTYSFEGAIIKRYNDSVLALIDEANTNAEIREFLQKRAGPNTPPLLGFDVKKWILDNVSDPLSQQLAQLQQQNDGFQASLDELTTLTQSEFAKLNASLADMRGVLVEIDKQQKDILGYLKDQQARQKAEDLAVAKAKEHERKLRAAQAGIFIVSSLIGLKYPERGRQIAVVGTAVIQVGETYRQWMTAVAGLSATDKVFNLSTVIATGNVLGAVMNVVSLFGDSQPSPEQQILEEIAKLRQEVNQLRTEMHDRFDRVDRELNLIFTTMHDRFDQIDVQLGKIAGDIHELRVSLASLSVSLGRIERNNYVFLDSLGRRPLLNMMNGALGYRERTGNPMPYEPTFVDAENAFFTWGATTAFDALAAGPQQRDYRDSQVFDELESLPLDSNLNYLNGWLMANGHPSISSKRLPGIRDWLFAVRAYNTLGLENPDHLGRINRNRTQTLDQVGQEIESALKRIAIPISPTGTLSDSAVISGALSFYDGKRRTLENALANVEQAYFIELTSTLGLNRETPFDLFGGVTQTLQHKTPEFVSFSCAGTAPILETPNNLGRVANGYAVITLADYLHLPADAFKVCLSAEWVNVEVECPNGNCRQIANLSVTLSVYAGETFAGQQVYVDEERRSVSLSTQPLAYAYSHWAELKPRLESATPSSDPILISDEPRLKAIALVEGALATYQHQLYARMADALNPGGALASVGKELAGANKLLAAFITLGMPNALEQDEVLHGLLFGGQALLDDLSFSSALAISTTQPISGSELSTNQRLVLMEIGDERVEAFAQLAAAYLRNMDVATTLHPVNTTINSNVRHVESFDGIAAARRDLRLALVFSVKDVGNRKIHLPFLSR